MTRSHKLAIFQWNHMCTYNPCVCYIQHYDVDMAVVAVFLKLLEAFSHPHDKSPAVSSNIAGKSRKSGVWMGNILAPHG